MPEINLPDISLQWSQGGDILKPSDAKIQQGWQVEIPPRQWFNWLDNRQDQAIAHIAQHGISVWSPDLEYQANKSYVQGSDGIVYKALTTNININPVGGAVGNWQSAFLTADQAVQVASAAQARAMTANNVYLSPLQLANAFSGSNQSFSANGFQKLPGGLILQWGVATVNDSAGGTTVTYPTPFPNSVFVAIAIAQLDNSAMSQNTGLTSKTTVDFAGTVANTGGTAVSNLPNGTVFRWFAIGY